MSILTPRRFQAVDAEQAAALRNAVDRIPTSGTARLLTVDNAPAELPPPVQEAVLELLQRFAAGDSVVIGSTETLLTTSQAAEMLGISHTYLLRLADSGKLPVQYRGTHRRFALDDIVQYLEASTSERAEK